MHIPDGFLSVSTWLPTWVLSVGGIGYCVNRASKIFNDKLVPMMGVMSAFIFAAQMLNFPVAGGTSGHLLGGVLAVVLLGPYPGAIVISVVLIIQALLFQDGGITALGANIFNMAIVGALGGYLVYAGLFRVTKGKLVLSTAVASWFSVVASASVCALELALSGTSPLTVALPAMAGIHAIIGVGEAVITTLVVSFVLKVRPDLVYARGHA